MLPIQLKKILFILSVILVLFLALAILWPVQKKRLDSTLYESTRIYDRRGTLLREVLSDEQGRGIRVPLAGIARQAQMAFIAIEDKRFYRHPGIDPLAIARALRQNLSGRRIVSGGSTITQQLARHLYHLPRKWYLKPIEAILAVRLEIWLSKEQILELYLNRIPFGNQTFGIEAASRLYFDKPAAHLATAEAAFLAGLPQAPGRYNPYAHYHRARRRQLQVLQMMLKNNLIDSAEYRTALATPIRVVPPQKRFRAPHFCQMLLERTDRQQARELVTTLDYALQSRIQTLVRGHIENLKSSNVTNAAVVVIENSTGAVRVWIGSRDFFDEQHSGQVDGVRALRQPGSTLKPFTYGLALENSYTAATILPDIETRAWTTEGDFIVRNYDETFHGPVRLRTALACSYNVPAVRVLESLGSDLLLSRLHRAGIKSLKKSARFYGLGLTLGNGEVTLLELTNAYAALARGGLVLPVRFLRDKTSQSQPDSGPAQALFSPQICFILSDILSDPGSRAPAFGQGGPLRLPFQCAVKTGTSKDFRDNWTIGYTTKYTVGVWVGNFDGQPMQQVSGVSGAGPLFHDIMIVLHEKENPPPFPHPPGIVRREICAASGMLPTANCPSRLGEWFVPGTEPEEHCTVHRAFLIDVRNGLLATDKTPKACVEKRVYEQWPPLYEPWLAQHNRPLPPRQRSPLSGDGSDQLTIIFPDDGDIFKIDPILRPQYQTLELQAFVPPGIRKIQWLVDEKVIATVGRPFSYRWRLTKGKHVLQVKASLSEKVLQSQTVTIQVF